MEMFSRMNGNSKGNIISLREIPTPGLTVFTFVNPSVTNEVLSPGGFNEAFRVNRLIPNANWIPDWL